MSYDIRALRRTEFPWADAGEMIYLNNASTGPLPSRAVAVTEEWARLRTNPQRISQDLQGDPTHLVFRGWRKSLSWPFLDEIEEQIHLGVYRKLDLRTVPTLVIDKSDEPRRDLPHTNEVLLNFSHIPLRGAYRLYCFMIRRRCRSR